MKIYIAFGCTVIGMASAIMALLVHFASSSASAMLPSGVVIDDDMFVSIMLSEPDLPHCYLWREIDANGREQRCL